MARTTLADLRHCMEGVIPSLIATCDREGVPNVTYLSQVHTIDDRHVALSCQFFNKTKRNVLENPYATVVLYDPITFDAWRMRLRYDHSETEGPLFDGMAARIQVIASHTGMTGVFRLIASDVYEVLEIEPVTGFLLPPDPVVDARAPELSPGPLTELRGLQCILERIARSEGFEELLDGVLLTLDELLGFSHSMILLADAQAGHLVARATHGYGPYGVGAVVNLGEGLIGTVAEQRRMIRMAGMGAELRYGRAIRQRAVATLGEHHLHPEVPLPGLPDAQAQLAVPLLAEDRLVGVLALESRDPLCFDEWDEVFFQIVAGQIALAIERSATEANPTASSRRRRRFVFYKNDDCVFVDGEYLIRNVPGRILWKILTTHRREHRTEFTNRELRLDPALGLPPIKDNLESRLILLRKRLTEKCPDLRLVPVTRGRFALELDCDLELDERDGG